VLTLHRLAADRSTDAEQLNIGDRQQSLAVCWRLLTWINAAIAICF
jgi:hypothetical protein